MEEELSTDLSYDTFLNDSIIPEQYDVVSVGTGGADESKDMNIRERSPGVSYEDLGDLSNKDYLTKIKRI